MSYSWAKPGVKVVCIKDTFIEIDPPKLKFTPFRKGEIYTISSVEIDPEYGLFLTFVGRSPYNWGHINGFRPIITKTQKQDVAIFAPLLNTSRVDA